MRRIIVSYLASTATFAKADDTGSDKAIDKAVYLRGDDTIKHVLLRAEATALSTLEFVASMVVHMAARCYNPVAAERAKGWNDVQTELLGALKEHAQLTRKRDFNRAWVYRLLSVARRMGTSLMTDYDKKGVQPGSPLETILRAKTVDKAINTVVEFMNGKVKGGVANSVDALDKALATPVSKGKASAKSRKGQGAGKASNNQKPATTAATAKTIMGNHAEEVFQAIPAKSAKDRANKLADKVGAANNVDHAAFILRSLTFVNDADKLMAIAEKATELAKAIQAKANENADTGKPDKAVAAQG